MNPKDLSAGEPETFMPMYYAVVANMLITTEDRHGVKWTRVVHLPTFFLSENLHGIRNDEHAEMIAQKIIGGGLAMPGVEVNITAVRTF